MHIVFCSASLFSKLEANLGEARIRKNEIRIGKLSLSGKQEKPKGF